MPEPAAFHSLIYLGHIKAVFLVGSVVDISDTERRALH